MGKRIFRQSIYVQLYKDIKRSEMINLQYQPQFRIWINEQEYLKKYINFNICYEDFKRFFHQLYVIDIYKNKIAVSAYSVILCTPT